MTSQLPRLYRKGIPPNLGIVHLGLGAFFRSHGALVIENAMSDAGGDWGILGVSLKSPLTRNKLALQGNLYTAVQMDPESQIPRIVEVLNDVLFAPEDPTELVSRLSDPMVRIVSLTITEKGYCHVPSTGELNIQHKDIQNDIHNTEPISAIGYLVRALAIRRANGCRPFTVLSCDNLPNNGKVARNVVVGLAELIDPSLAYWINKEGRFPSTMVDRIVPATTQQDIQRLAALTGKIDEAPVFHEPFLQWVIEDDFVDGQRPYFENTLGVKMVKDVTLFEHMKVRMLNGAHSSLAYLGYLAGYQTIAETVKDPLFTKFILKLWNQEIIPTLTAPEGIKLHAYGNDLLDRFSNPAIRHRTWQIAMDGSQKLPQRIVATIVDNLDVGRPCHGLTLALAAWMRYVGGTDDRGERIEVKDPLASKLLELSNSGLEPRAKVANLLSIEEIFPIKIAERLHENVTAAYSNLVEKGARGSLETVTELL